MGFNGIGHLQKGFKFGLELGILLRYNGMLMEYMGYVSNKILLLQELSKLLVMINGKSKVWGSHILGNLYLLGWHLEAILHGGVHGISWKIQRLDMGIELTNKFVGCH